MVNQPSYMVMIERLRAFAEGHYLIQHFTHGQYDIAHIGKDDHYPFMHVVPVNITVDTGIRAYSFDIIFGDVPRDKENKAEYQKEVISDCQRLAEDLLAEILNGHTLFGIETEIQGQANIEPFIEEGPHTFSGVTLQVTLVVPWDWNACDIPAGYSVGGSGSGGSGGSGSGGGLTCETLVNCTVIQDHEERITALEESGGGGGGGFDCNDVKECAEIVQLQSDVNALEAAAPSYQLKSNLETTVIDTSTTKYPNSKIVKEALDTKVPYTGATADVDLGANSINSESVNVTGTAGGGHVNLKHQSADATATGQSTAVWADTNGDIKWKNDGNYKTTLKTSTNSADRVYTFPNETCELMPRNAAITGATKTKITYDADGLVTLGEDAGIADITGLQTALDGKAATSHTHTVSQISDSTTVGQNLVKLPNPSAITFLRVNADNTVTARTAAELRSDLGIVDTVSFCIDTNGDTVTAATTTYYNPYAGQVTDNTTETNRQAVIPFSGTLKNLFVQTTTTQSATGSLVFTIRKNGADTSVTLTVPAGGAAAVRSDLVNSVSVAAGDLISIKAVNNTAAAASATIKSIAFIIERTQ